MRGEGRGGVSGRATRDKLAKERRLPSQCPRLTSISGRRPEASSNREGGGEGGGKRLRHLICRPVRALICHVGGVATDNVVSST